MRLKWFLFLVMMVSSVMGQAQVRKYANDFLNIGAGARGIGLSGAHIAMVDDIYATYYNPAGLVHIQSDIQIGLMHNEYFGGIGKYDYVGFALPVADRKGTLGISMIRFGVDDIPNTLFLIGPDGSVNYDNITSFSTADYGFFFSYGHQLPVEGFSVGGSFKLIYRNVGSFAKAWGFGLDAGLQYRVKGWRFGFSARDITSTFTAWTFSFTEEEQEVLLQTNNELPDNSIEIAVPTFSLAAGYEANIKDQFYIRPELALEFNTDGQRNVLISGKPLSMDLNFGLEMDFRHILYLRSGIGQFQRATDDLGNDVTTFVPTIGGGIRIKSFAIDYTFTDLGNQSDALYSHVISLSLGIMRKTAEE
jgi:hypothetical protein